MQQANAKSHPDEWIRVTARHLAVKVGASLVYSPPGCPINAYTVSKAGRLRTGLWIMRVFENIGHSDVVEIDAEEMDRVYRLSDGSGLRTSLVVKFNDAIATRALLDSDDFETEGDFVLIPVESFRKILVGS